ncbi:pyridoxamine 5'-phosphate oxidase family protein [Tardiphaga sp. vice304]|uniref:MSMEG_1061 family FMN-dependent PPOX-type flavoprotein n=1 Tax=unclassified Tardiphaga TaxID=2631404 RepID=UPI001161EBC9|nr:MULTISPECIES: MSMEG_1061 family FMN-dependent PPOX-type flavoprotein [unclassified Tardiphaga]QDM16243.1 pyridoxamine 5'-phosphate oxidase family protein [Tardiphaga sp. vice278]QDM26452.1 pyridoxamine 5'-phosphate oxidase family protein [Tardiphaga sp. vice304]
MTEVAADDLRSIYPAPHGRVIAKARPTLDVHSAKFIGLSPFCVMASSGPDGTVDASPRGGGVGFVRVTSPSELLMPDRPGNNRVDTLQNLLHGSGFLQLIFFVPGIDDSLRVSGMAKLVRDPELMASMEEFGKLPRAVLRITVTEAYFHCGKALMRSKLWFSEAQVKRSVMPSISEIVHDQTQIGEPVGQAEIDAAYRQQL